MPARPEQVPAGFFNIVTGSYDFPVAHCAVDGVYTNKAPGGVAYRCSFRVTEAAYCIERAMDILAQKLEMDPAELRIKNFIGREQFPYQSALGWEYDSGDYHTAMKKAMDEVGYRKLREEQKVKQEAFERGETRRPHGHRRDLLHGDRRRRAVAQLRYPGHRHVRLGGDPYPSDGAVIARMGTKSQGQGHETTMHRSSRPSWACRPTTS
jgi:carbon-monoxide dehydrogenase large subunit